MGRPYWKPVVLAVLVILLFALPACQPAYRAGTPTATPISHVEQIQSSPAPIPAPQPTATPAITPIHLPPDLYPLFGNLIDLPSGYELTLDAGLAKTAGLTLDVTSEYSWSEWIYALAAPFPTITDEVASADLIALWQSGTPIPNGPERLLADAAALYFFTNLWGPPSEAVDQRPTHVLLNSAWQLDVWALVPFDELEPRWKVIAVNGQNPLHKDFDASSYPLQINIGFKGDPELIAQLSAASGLPSRILPLTNRDPDRLTTVVLTGVTALVRGTAAYMGQFGMDYPARDILPILAGADILHISNEVAFAEDCPAPSNQEGLAFCSQERYIRLLDVIGADVIELSGDHLADWGQDTLHFTLGLYRQRGWPVYAGGETLEQAMQPALFKHNGNRIAFLGCNYKHPQYATASETTAGTVHCDPAWLDPAIRDVTGQGYLPIVTLQDEEYYTYAPQYDQAEHFQAAAQAGAVIVSGSQAHQPQGMAFEGDSFLHYGLGNLFFDQVYTQDSTRQAFIDRHVFYDGRYIGVELLTITFVDYARSRFSTPEERRSLLQEVFEASEWECHFRVE